MALCMLSPTVEDFTELVKNRFYLIYKKSPDNFRAFLYFEFYDLGKGEPTGVPHTCPGCPCGGFIPGAVAAGVSLVSIAGAPVGCGVDVVEVGVGIVVVV